MLPKILYQTNKCRKCCQNVAKDILSNEEKAKMLPEDLLLNEENVAKDLTGKYMRSNLLSEFVLWLT